MTSDRARQRVRALQSAVIYATNDRAGASEIALPIASDPSADALARLRASTAAAGGLSFSGHPHAALELCEAVLPVAFEHAHESQRGVGWVVAQMLVAYNCLGRFDEATQIVAGFRDAAIADGDDEVVGSATLVLARLALTRGDLVTARSMAREAAAALHAYDAAGYLPWCLGLVAQIAAQLGDAAAARDTVAELDRMEWAVRLNDYEVAIGRAWTAVAAGELTTPVRNLLEAAAEEASNSSRFTQGILLHEALRIGAQPRDVIDGLEESCATGELPIHDVFLAHARALEPTTTARRSRRCRSRSSATGVLLLAAESRGRGGRGTSTRRPPDACGTRAPAWRPGCSPRATVPGLPRSPTCLRSRSSPAASSR